MEAKVETGEQMTKEQLVKMKSKDAVKAEETNKVEDDVNLKMLL